MVMFHPSLQNGRRRTWAILAQFFNDVISHHLRRCSTKWRSRWFQQRHEIWRNGRASTQPLTILSQNFSSTHFCRPLLRRQARAFKKSLIKMLCPSGHTWSRSMNNFFSNSCPDFISGRSSYFAARNVCFSQRAVRPPHEHECLYH
jgi:hypothetical protein